MTEPQPGDFFVVQVKGIIGFLIRLGQWLAGCGWSKYQHAGIYVGNGKVVEAEPGGARIADLSEYDGRPIAWSTGLIPLTDWQRNLLVMYAEAEALLKTPYSALDYFAIALHRFRIPVPGLRGYIKSSRHMICSQLVDWLYNEVHVKLFVDDRWDGYVTPADLGNLIESLRARRSQLALAA